jgi:hypothetical protein
MKSLTLTRYLPLTMHLCYMVLRSLIPRSCALKISKSTSFSTLTDSTVSNSSNKPGHVDSLPKADLRDDGVDSESDSEDHDKAFLTFRERAAISNAKRINKEEVKLSTWYRVHQHRVALASRSYTS